MCFFVLFLYHLFGARPCDSFMFSTNTTNLFGLFHSRCESFASGCTWQCLCLGKDYLLLYKWDAPFFTEFLGHVHKLLLLCCWNKWCPFLGRIAFMRTEWCRSHALAHISVAWETFSCCHCRVPFCANTLCTSCRTLEYFPGRLEASESTP